MTIRMIIGMLIGTVISCSISVAMGVLLPENVNQALLDFGVYFFIGMIGGGGGAIIALATSSKYD
jgi:hypothetical protein